ncbi:MAG: endonuclease Q family protein [Candidatus Pacearchaeota archaeon]
MVEIIADLQIHSKYSRATSKDLNIENLEKYGKIKGLNLLGIGDFQHPLHRKDINSKLKEDSNGILWTKRKEVAFLWQTEVSLMFKQGGKQRAVHLLIFSPNSKTSDKITDYLSEKGRLDYDGRPIFGITCRDFTRDLKKIDDDIEIIPAHCLTPFFGIFGSKSGFNSLKEAFGDMVNHIYAVESGMSADPSMLWRFEEIANGKIRVVSFSDAHSFWPWRIGREATIFDIPTLSYKNIVKAIRTGEGLKATIETPPEYGKYHWDGHRLCNFSSSPAKTKELNEICPKCGNKLTIGVEYRVEETAKYSEGFKPKNAKLFYKILPLHELLVLCFDKGISSKGNWEVYRNLIDKFGTEFNLLLNIEKHDILKEGISEKLVDLIIRNRVAGIKVKPGYDGVYGEAILTEQKKLF